MDTALCRLDPEWPLRSCSRSIFLQEEPFLSPAFFFFPTDDVKDICEKVMI